MRIVITITIAKSILYLMLDVRFQMSLILLQNISHNAFAFLREHNHTSIPILSYPILSYPILSYFILSYPILSYPILSYPILSYPILSYFILSKIRKYVRLIHYLHSVCSFALHLFLLSLLKETLCSLRLRKY